MAYIRNSGLHKEKNTLQNDQAKIKRKSFSYFNLSKRQQFVQKVIAKMYSVV